MKYIRLETLTLKNFKGVKDLSINFGDITNISAENGKGKTTIFDAAMWLLFDKDSTDRKKFEIKTLDEGGQVIHGLDHSVEGTFIANGEIITLAKTFKEKWTKQRGALEKTLTGHETLYFIDEVPAKKGEFEWKIAQFIEEGLFKLITSPTYFNTNLKWQDRRNLLMDIIGDISEEDVIKANETLLPLIPLLGGKDVETLKKSVAAKKKKVNDELKTIPVRIDEINNSMLEVDNIEEVKDQLVKANEKHSLIKDKALQGNGSIGLVKGKQNEIMTLHTRVNNLRIQATTEGTKPLVKLQEKASALDADIKTTLHSIKLFKSELTMNKEEKEREESALIQLRGEWHIENDKEFTQPGIEEFICPTCKRELDSSDVEDKIKELEGNFNEEKAKKLEVINVRGGKIKERVKSLEGKIKTLETSLSDLELKYSELVSLFDNVNSEIDNFKVDENINKDEIDTLNCQIEKLQQEIEGLQKPTDIDSIKAELSEVEKEIKELSNKVIDHENNLKLKSRIEELMQQEKELSKLYAQLEGHEYLCESFIRAKVDLLEDKINNKFENVKFKLFNTLVNGGIEECCETLIDGVPYADANTASKINAGLDIINTLTEHHGITAPIFIDNRESINDIIESKSQIINLIVSKDKTIKVEVM
ncbi:MAG: recombinase RecF [Clostridium sp.]